MGNTLGVGVGVGIGLGLTVGYATLIQAAGPKIGDEVVASQYQYNTEDIDEYSAERLRDAMSYAKDNAMLIQVPVLGTTKTFWRLSDEATRISRKLALILRSQHSVCKYLTAPLQVSNVWIGSTGNVKLRGVSFTGEGFFSIERVRDDYKHLSRVLGLLIMISGGDINKLPPDYKDFLLLLRRNNLTRKDEFLIVNNAALLPMKNRTEVFLMLHCVISVLNMCNTPSTEDIDESSAEELRDATSYAKDNALLIQVPVLGTATKTFWRLSDEATRISRKLALILRNYHSVCKCLTAPLQVSNVWVGSAGNVKLRGARFTTKGFSIERVRDDYKNLSRMLKQLISISGGDINKLPPDYSQFLLLLTKDKLKRKDEFLIVNNAALLPMKNRTEVFLMLHCVISVLNMCNTPSTEDIDESSAEELRDATSYAKDNALLIQVPVLGTTTKTFWRLSDEATRISRKLALILRNYHSKCKCLTAPLQVSNVWVGSAGDVKLRGARFTTKGFRIERVRDDYKNLSRVLKQLISISGGDINKLPPDYSEFLLLLTKDNLTTEDEFLIVNNAALLPLKNRTEVFLMLYDRIVKYLGRKNRAKRNIILSSLPYENDWLDTATSNTKINQWVVKSDVQKKEYKRTALDLLRLNRNVRSHLHEYGHDDDIEEILYCEWPMLLIAMEKQLHMEGELQDTDIKNKFG